jgi:3-hydroxyacyl-CoA dehydrogenase
MKAFEVIGTAQVAKSAEQARSMGFLSPNDGITMNRDRLLSDAKKLLIEISVGYTPPEPRTYSLPGKSGKAALQLAVNDLALAGKVTPHDIIVTNALAEILTGGDTDITELLEEDDILSMERETISMLAKNTDTLDRMQHMLEKGKPLRN